MLTLCLFVSWKTHAAAFHNCAHICFCYVIFSLLSVGNEVYVITLGVRTHMHPRALKCFL